MKGDFLQEKGRNGHINIKEKREISRINGKREPESEKGGGQEKKPEKEERRWRGTQEEEGMILRRSRIRSEMGEKKYK